MNGKGLVRAFLSFLAVALLLLSTVRLLPAAVIAPRLQEKIESAAPTEEIPIIITMAEQVPVRPLAAGSKERGPARGRARARAEMVRNLRLQAETSQGPLKEFLRGKGKTRFAELWIINGLAVSASPALIAEIARQPEVASVFPDSVISLPGVVPSAVTGPVEWNIEDVNAPALWNLGFDGQGVVVATLDTGVDIDHPDLAGKERTTANWFNPYAEACNQPGAVCSSCDKSADVACDGEGHGTSVMGIILGGSAGGSAIGVAPGARWIAAKIFRDAPFSSGSAEAQATASAIHQSFQWILDPDGDPATDDAPDLVNNSWALDAVNQCLDTQGEAENFQPDIQTLKAAGIAVIFAAGNDGPAADTSSSPANYPESLAVGALDMDNLVASFSSRGPSACDNSTYPEVTAPGVSIRTADLSGGLGLLLNPYRTISGTSFSAPHVSGVMALLQQTSPTVPFSTLETAVLASADDLGLPGPDNDYGKGLVNALAAYRYLSGQPHLSVYDPDPPENDRSVGFGTEQVNGGSATRVLTVYNAGSGSLAIDSVDSSALGGNFSVTSDLCAGTSLEAGQECSISVAFSPQMPGTFDVAISMFSNNPDGNPVSVSLSGIGKTTLAPPQLLADPGNVDFGSVPVSGTAARDLRISNGGDEDLVIGQATISSQGPFSLSSDNCSGHTLLSGQSCSMVVVFAPKAHQTFSGSVVIPSNDPASPKSVSLQGIGNHPPAPAILETPANGATGLTVPVTLQWIPGKDPDGDPVQESVFLSTSPDFSQSTTFPVASSTGTGSILAAGMGGGLLFFGLLAGPGRGSRKVMLQILVAAVSLGLLSCGGGGGGSSPPKNAAYTLQSLNPATTYYWKISSRDSFGAVTESGAWSFTTR